MAIFNSYVSLPEGKWFRYQVLPTEVFFAVPMGLLNGELRSKHVSTHLARFGRNWLDPAEVFSID